MERVERDRDEDTRIGVPSNQKRIEVLESVVERLLALSSVSVNDPVREGFDKIKNKLDQLDIDFPAKG